MDRSRSYFDAAVRERETPPNVWEMPGNLPDQLLPGGTVDAPGTPWIPGTEHIGRALAGIPSTEKERIQGVTDLASNVIPGPLDDFMKFLPFLAGQMKFLPRQFKQYLKDLAKTRPEIAEHVQGMGGPSDQMAYLQAIEGTTGMPGMPKRKTPDIDYTPRTGPESSEALSAKQIAASRGKEPAEYDKGLEIESNPMGITGEASTLDRMGMTLDDLIKKARTTFQDVGKAQSRGAVEILEKADPKTKTAYQRAPQPAKRAHSQSRPGTERSLAEQSARWISEEVQGRRSLFPQDTPSVKSQASASKVNLQLKEMGDEQQIVARAARDAELGGNAELAADLTGESKALLSEIARLKKQRKNLVKDFPESSIGATEALKLKGKDYVQRNAPALTEDVDLKEVIPGLAALAASSGAIIGEALPDDPSPQLSPKKRFGVNPQVNSRKNRRFRKQNQAPLPNRERTPGTEAPRTAQIPRNVVDPEGEWKIMQSHRREPNRAEKNVADIMWAIQALVNMRNL